jgi:hypothetical protein
MEKSIPCLRLIQHNSQSVWSDIDLNPNFINGLHKNLTYGLKQSKNWKCPTILIGCPQCQILNQSVRKVMLGNGLTDRQEDIYDLRATCSVFRTLKICT